MREILIETGDGTVRIMAGHQATAFLIKETDKRSLIPMTESEFSRYWQYQVIDSENMYTEAGEPLKVLYPGRRNDIQGADFRDAVVISGDETLTGNVEIHLKSGDWRNHGHHRDPRYNNVVLHVVRKHNAKSGTLLQNGEEIPVLELEKYLANQEEEPAATGQIAGIPCSGIGQPPPPEGLFTAIDSAGVTRFLDTVKSFRKEITSAGAGEALYRGIMTALGYSGNKEPFREAAVRLPLKEIEALNCHKQAAEDYLFRVQMVLLGTAGFLSQEFVPALQRSGISLESIEQLRQAWLLSGEDRIVPRTRWQLCMIRPHNSPVVRMVAMTHLLDRFRESGLAAGLRTLVEKSAGSGSRRDLEKGLEISIPAPYKPDKPLTLLGKNRAAAIAVNVLLPFFFATRKTGRINREQIMAFYREYPKPAVNSLEKHMVMQLGLDRKVIKTAVRQQGLIHLYKEFCTKGTCGICPLGQLQTREHVQ